MYNKLATEAWQQPSGQFLITMSNKQNEVIKFIGQEQSIKCEKIITLHCEKDRQLLQHYLAQIQRIQDYLQRLHQLPSHLSTAQHLELYRKYTQDGRIVLKMVSRFWEYPTFEDFLRNEAIRPDQQLKRDFFTLTHFLIQFLQIILRAGGIDFFFYTPRNLFLIAPTRGQYMHPFSKIMVNFTSLVGIKLLIGNKKLIKEDFCQIYPLLPPNFFQLRETGQWLQISSIIKKRAFGFLILCFIIRKVPEMIDHKKLDVHVPDDIVKMHLSNSVALFQKMLYLFKKYFFEAGKMTGIKFNQLLTLIFVTPYQEGKNGRDIQLISWEQIYTRLFQESTAAKKQWEHIQANKDLLNASIYFKKMLLTIWKTEKNQQYYLDRDYAKIPEGAETQSIVYFLTKINCNFHKLLAYRDACQLILREQFSEDASQVVMRLMKLFTEEQAKIEKEEEIEVEKATGGEVKEKLREWGMDSTAGSASLRLFNPFSIRNQQQMSEIQQELSPDNPPTPFFNKLKSIPQFLGSISSFEYIQSDTKKQIISLSQKQTILSEFCCTLWPN